MVKKGQIYENQDPRYPEPRRRVRVLKRVPYGGKWICENTITKRQTTIAVRSFADAREWKLVEVS